MSWDGDRNCSFSIDRIDNTKGYTKQNCIVVSYKANSAKGPHSLEELELLVSNLKAVRIERGMS